MKRRWYPLVVLVAVATTAAGCRGDNGPDPVAVKSATAAGELVGSTLAEVVAELRQVKTADPTLTTDQAFDQLEAEGSLVRARDSIDQALALKDLDLSEMVFRFSEGVASRLPPIAGVVVEPNMRPKYERGYKGEDRRFIMKGFVNWAAARAMLVDDGSPTQFRSLFIGDKGPPPSLLDPAGNVVITNEGQRFLDLLGWISANPKAAAVLERIRRTLAL